MLTCQCPPPTALPDIPCVQCPERFGQIQKVAFQRLTADDGTKNGFPKSGGNDTITDLANWQSAMTAADSTKIVISPYIYSPTQESGAPRTFGGGNDSLNGVEEIIGRELSAFTASVRNCPQSVISALKQMQCEGSLGVYLFDQYGNVECIVDENGNAYPIPIKSFFVGDKVHGGIDAPDTNVIQWSFVKNYSDDLRIFVLETFNPLTDFCGGASPEPPTPPEPQKAYIQDVNAVHNYVLSSTTSCVFGYKSAHSTSGYTMTGYLDDENLIEIWQDGTNVMFLSDADMYAPANCSNFFADCSALTSLDLSNFNTANVTNMQGMFINCPALTTLDLSNFNTANVTNMQAMFTYCSALTSLNLSNFNTANVTTMNGMFNGCSDLRTIYGGDWNKSSLMNGDDMFTDCADIVGGNGTSYDSNHTSATYARIDRVGTPGYFTQA